MIWDEKEDSKAFILVVYIPKEKEEEEILGINSPKS